MGQLASQPVVKLEIRDPAFIELPDKPAEDPVKETRKKPDLSREDEVQLVSNEDAEPVAMPQTITVIRDYDIHILRYNKFLDYPVLLIYTKEESR